MKEKYDVAIIGGGPAGSTIATLLAKKGRSVILFEKEQFPRYHIGESLVTGVMPILKELGIDSEMEKEEFIKKYGITLVWGNHSKPWKISFEEADPNNNAEFKYTFEVEREKFDYILLQHAIKSGVEVHQNTLVKKVNYKNNRCVGLSYKSGEDEITEIQSDFVVDASGQSALISKKNKNINYDEELKNLAVWSYFKDGKRYEDTEYGNIIIENIKDGWLWYIPQRDNITSVGYVAPTTRFKKQNIKNILPESIDKSSEVKKMLEPATEISQRRTIKDWSYHSEKFAGPGYLLTGDAAGFVDPLFSTGVFLAMNSASLGARIINEILDSPENEQELFLEYEEKYKSFLSKVTDFVHYFYDASKVKDEYFRKADELVTPIDAMTSRQEFVYLISGLAGSHTLEYENTKEEY
ncbi:tryptophan halogenase [Staphylococcus pasteuri]|uniref:NAD(P)/FAD-dependent oxidoreductase n=1 Tax=Staphylococcus pasteuri TaxID=45972 RepID=UPI000D3B8667|nr:NAD(P)/FAD-dependent oxidoreductase [Staphylococcus pasteuri]PTU86833.1 tryptophan halogenase [Staphylococcus pasteuri]